MVIVKDPLGFRLIRNIILVSTFFSMIMTAIQLYVDYRSEKDQIRDSLEQVKDSSLESLSHTLWQSNYELLDIQLKNLLRLNDITYIMIQGSSGENFAFGKDMKEDSIEMRYALNFTYNGQQYTLGELVMQSSLDRARDKVLERFLLIAVTQSIKTFIVAFLIMYIFSRMVTQHLYKVLEFVSSLAEKGSSGEPLKLDLKGNEDELLLLQEALNEMFERINYRIEQGRTANEKLGELNAVLEKRMQVQGQEMSVTDRQNKINELRTLIRAIKGSQDVTQIQQDIKTLEILLDRLDH